MKGINIPILFIHGLGDLLISYTQSVDMYNANNFKKDKLLLIKKAQHVGLYSLERDRYCTEVKKFITENL